MHLPVTDLLQLMERASALRMDLRILPSGEISMRPVDRSAGPASKMTSAEKQRAYRDRIKTGTIAETVTVKVTPYGENVTPVTCVTEEGTPPSPPLSPSPKPPTPHTPIPVQEEGAPTHEATTPDFFHHPAPVLSPTKRIAWSLDTGWQGIEAADMERFAAAAPAVNLDRAISAADLWLRANPTKRKQNPYRFLVNWLGRQQERGGDAPSSRPYDSGPAKEAPRSFAQIDREAKEEARHGPEVIKMRRAAVWVPDAPAPEPEPTCNQ